VIFFSAKSTIFDAKLLGIVIVEVLISHISLTNLFVVYEQLTYSVVGVRDVLPCVFGSCDLTEVVALLGERVLVKNLCSADDVFDAFCVVEGLVGLEFLPESAEHVLRLIDEFVVEVDVAGLRDVGL
jgi:hypothetical protein